MNDEYVCSGWACVDCRVLLANGENPVGTMTEDEIESWLADIAIRNTGYNVTLGLLREDHGCASNYTVTYLMPGSVRGSYRRGTVEVLADNGTEAMDAAFWKIPVDAWITMIRSHDLETEFDRGGECECEQQTFSWEPCDYCGSNLGGTRHAISFWKILP